MDKINEAKIISAIALSDTIKNKIEKFCRAEFNKKIQFVYEIDSSIIGGIIIIYNDSVYDGSVFGQLKKIAANFEY